MESIKSQIGRRSKLWRIPFVVDGYTELKRKVYEQKQKRSRPSDSQRHLNLIHGMYNAPRKITGHCEQKTQRLLNQSWLQELVQTYLEANKMPPRPQEMLKTYYSSQKVQPLLGSYEDYYADIQHCFQNLPLPEQEVCALEVCCKSRRKKIPKSIEPTPLKRMELRSENMPKPKWLLEYEQRIQQKQMEQMQREREASLEAALRKRNAIDKFQNFAQTNRLQNITRDSRESYSVPKEPYGITTKLPDEAKKSSPRRQKSKSKTSDRLENQNVPAKASKSSKGRQYSKKRHKPLRHDTQYSKTFDEMLKDKTSELHASMSSRYILHKTKEKKPRRHGPQYSKTFDEMLKDKTSELHASMSSRYILHKTKEKKPRRHGPQYSKTFDEMLKDKTSELHASMSSRHIMHKSKEKKPRRHGPQYSKTFDDMLKDKTSELHPVMSSRHMLHKTKEKKPRRHGPQYSKTFDEMIKDKTSKDAPLDPSDSLFSRTFDEMLGGELSELKQANKSSYILKTANTHTKHHKKKGGIVSGIPLHRNVPVSSRKRRSVHMPRLEKRSTKRDSYSSINKRKTSKTESEKSTQNAVDREHERHKSILDPTKSISSFVNYYEMENEKYMLEAQREEEERIEEQKRREDEKRRFNETKNEDESNKKQPDGPDKFKLKPFISYIEKSMVDLRIVNKTRNSLKPEISNTSFDTSYDYIPLSSNQRDYSNDSLLQGVSDKTFRREYGSILSLTDVFAKANSDESVVKPDDDVSLEEKYFQIRQHLQGIYPLKTKKAAKATHIPAKIENTLPIVEPPAPHSTPAGSIKSQYSLKIPSIETVREWENQNLSIVSLKKEDRDNELQLRKKNKQAEQDDIALLRAEYEKRIKELMKEVQIREMPKKRPKRDFLAEERAKVYKPPPKPPKIKMRKKFPTRISEIHISIQPTITEVENLQGFDSEWSYPLLTPIKATIRRYSLASDHALAMLLYKQRSSVTTRRSNMMEVSPAAIAIQELHQRPIPTQKNVDEHCPCALCEFMDRRHREKESPLIKEMKAKQHKMELCTIYHNMLKQNEIESKTVKTVKVC